MGKYNNLSLEELYDLEFELKEKRLLDEPYTAFELTSVYKEMLKRIDQNARERKKSDNHQEQFIKKN